MLSLFLFSGVGYGFHLQEREAVVFGGFVLLAGEEWWWWQREVKQWLRVRKGQL